MKRKLIGIVLTVVCSLACAFAITACTQPPALSTPPDGHVHSWSKDWQSDDMHHWHNCVANDCTITDNSQKDGYGAHDFTNGNCICGKNKPTEGLYYILNDSSESYSVAGIGTATETNIVIAPEYEGKPVTAVRNSAFFFCSSLTSVIIPNNVTSIGSEAFRGCSSLTSISIPDSMTSIGSWAFDGCNKLPYNEYDNAYYLGNDTNPYVVLIKANNTSIVSCTVSENSKCIYESAFSGCTGLTSISIPNGVTSIGSGAFYECPIETATIPSIACNSVNNSALKTVVIISGTSIGSSAFRDCSNLTSITIPDSVTSIGSSAFYNCSSLTNISIPDSVTSIGSDAFYECPIETATIPSIACNSVNNSALKTVVIISGTSIGNSAFRDCSNLTSITIPDSVTSIGSDAFYGCRSLTSITIPNGVTSIEQSVFRVCTGLTSITIPNSVTSIGDYAFSDCSGLTSIMIPNSVTSIGDYAFQYCRSLTSITIPDSITSIGEYMFYSCKSLTSITIPDSVTSIGDYAFQYCSGLTSVSIGSNVAEIGERSFLGCSLLTSIIIPDGVIYIHDDAFDLCPIETATIPTIACKSVNNSALKTVVITSGRSIERQAFDGCSSLTSITIADSVTSIGEYAFSDCTSLTSITMPDSITSIGKDAFVSVPKLLYDNAYYVTYYSKSSSKQCLILIAAKNQFITSCNIPDNTKIIVTSALAGCDGIKNITIPDGVTSIGAGAFHGTTWYNSQPNGLVYAGKVAYTYKGKMSTNTSISLKNGTTSIADGAFANCSLTSITIPDSVTSIGSEAFRYCGNLTSIEIPNSVTSIGNFAFANCSLTSISIPNSVTSIGDSAFYGCDSLTSITISDGVTSIGSWAFDGCSNLTSITIPDSVKFIGSQAFDGCSSLTSITIPDSVTSIESWVFEDCDALTIYCEAASKPSSWANNWYYSSSLPVVWDCKNNDKDNNGYTYAVIDGIRYSLKDNVATVINQPSNIVTANIPSTVTYNNTTYSVTSIGQKAFYGCSNLTNITIPDSVTSIGQKAFYGCNKLQYNEYDNAYYLGNDANKYVALIEAKNTSITSCTIHENAKIIADRAFESCSSLMSISISDSVTSIGSGAFESCSSLTSITISDGVTSIGDSAFSGCTGLTSISIPDGVTSIGSSVFKDCSGLTSISIPNSVTSIGDSAFYYCSSLTSITFDGTVEQWHAIEKGDSWKYNAGNFTVTCTDGKLYITVA